MMRQQIKLAAVLAVVVLSLTGFSKSSHGHGHSGSSHGSGGGCSSSRSSNGGYHSSTGNNDYDDDDDGSGSGSGSSGSNSGYSTPTNDPTTAYTASADSAPTVRVIKCAQPADGSRKAVTSSQVELTPTSYGAAKVAITVTFFDSAGNLLDTAHKKVELDATDGMAPKKFTVPMATPAKVDEVYRCSATAVLAR
ncbi:hypothetical protein [Streptomyces sp. NPDC060184]|uniref:hypothetical protein n=1 Tax=Streptomyces sp. NPDC060184 TaxID=3347064 RepID=UPI00365858E5